MKLLLSLLLSFVVTISFAQVDKSNHSLLWEITGNGLAKPSYLFGTMHVQDERAHEFTDSTLLCLDATDAFAMEVNFDSIVQEILTIFLKIDTTNSLKGTLSPEAYGRLNEKIMEKTGKPLEEMDNKNPEFVRDMMMDWEEPDYTVKKDQIVDLYLMKRAKEQGHPYFGLEKMEDYLGVTQSYFELFENEESNKEPSEKDKNAYYEQLIDIYQRGNLNEVESSFINKEKRTQFDIEMLDNRNKKMVVNLIELMKDQTVFCAVGTAHLPGKEGMLEELKRQGYKVRKVEAAFEGYANNYEKTINNSWETFESKTHLYKIKAPGVSISLEEQFKSLGANASAHMNMDIMDQHIYLHMAMIPPGMNTQLTKDSIEARFVEKWGIKTGSEVKKFEDINRSDVEGKRLFTEDEKGIEAVWEVFIKGGLVYMFSVMKEDGKVSKDNYETYFESIEFLESKWKKYESEQGAFSVELPTKPAKRRVSVKNEFEGREDGQIVVKSLLAKDPVKSTTYVVRYSNMDEWSRIADSKEWLMSSLNILKEQLGNPKMTLDSLNYKGCFTYSAKFELQNSFFDVYFFNRGNRGMLLGIEYSKTGDHQNEKQRFFENFELLPFQNSALYPVSFDEGSFSINLPGKLVKSSSTTNDYPFFRETEYSTIDSMHSGNFMIDTYQMNPFYMTTSSDSSVINFSTAMLSSEENRVTIDTVFQGRKAIYVRDHNEKVDNRTYELIFYEDVFLFDLTACLSMELGEETAWEYFNSFKINSNSGKKYLLKDKKDILLKSLVGNDTILSNHALIAMNYAEFSPADLPKIYKTLEKKLPQNNKMREEIKSVLVRELQYTNDQTTIPFLEKIFYENKENRKSQIDILNTLTSLKSKPAFDLFFPLAKDIPKDTKVNLSHYTMFNNFLDTISLSKNYIDPLFSIIDDPSFSYYVYKFYLDICIKDPKNVELLKPLLPKFLTEANRIINSNQLDLAKDSIAHFDFYPHFKKLNSLFGYFKESKEVGDYYQKIKNIPDPNLLVNIIDAMLMRNDKVLRSTYNIVAANPYYWKLLLDAASYENNLDKLPVELFTPERTVESILAASVEDYYSQKMIDFKIVDTREHTISEEKLKMYTFTFKFSGSEETYFGICSQPVDKAQVSKNYFDYYTESYDPKKKEAIIADFLKEWEE